MNNNIHIGINILFLQIVNRDMTINMNSNYPRTQNTRNNLTSPNNPHRTQQLQTHPNNPPSTILARFPS